MPPTLRVECSTGFRSRNCISLVHLGPSWFGERGFNARRETIYNGELNADNANDVEFDVYHVSNLRLGYDRFSSGWEFAAFVGINNLFDESYNNNIRINAFGGRYFEPAPERNAFAGFTLRRKFSGRGQPIKPD